MADRATERRRTCRRLVGLLSLGVLVASCDPNSGFLQQASGPLLVLPQLVYVQRATTGQPMSFQLRAAPAAIENATINVGALTWSSDVAGTTFVQSGDAAIVQLPASLPAGSGLRITATDGGSSGSSVILLLGATTSPTDEVRAGPTLSADPDITFASGRRDTDCATDEMFAVVGSSPIGNWTGGEECDRREAALFSVHSRPFFAQPMPWTSAQEVVDATARPSANVVPLNVVIGVESAIQDTAERFVAGSLLFGEAVLHDMRAGITFPVASQTWSRVLLPDVRSCGTLSALPEVAKPKAGALNVYMLAEVNGTLRGRFCDAAPNVILLSWQHALSSTLVHEMGHALGLLTQNNGHVTSLFGFVNDNIMTTDAGAGAGEDRRTRLSLGQVYRMRLEGRSWINRDGGLNPGPLACPCDPYAGTVCPLLFADVRPVVGTPTAPFSGSCS